MITKEICILLQCTMTSSAQQQLAIEQGAVTELVGLLKHYQDVDVDVGASDTGGIPRRVADSLKALVSDNSPAKEAVRKAGGIEPLVKLLASAHPKVKKSALVALRVLASKNQANKLHTIHTGAVTHLVAMMESGEPELYTEAVGVVGNLVHSLPQAKIIMLSMGVLQVTARPATPPGPPPRLPPALAAPPAPVRRGDPLPPPPPCSPSCGSWRPGTRTRPAGRRPCCWASSRRSASGSGASPRATSSPPSWTCSPTRW